jgi:hypothetical protein
MLHLSFVSSIIVSIRTTRSSKAWLKQNLAKTKVNSHEETADRVFVDTSRREIACYHPLRLRVRQTIRDDETLLDPVACRECCFHGFLQELIILQGGHCHRNGEELLNLSKRLPQRPPACRSGKETRSSTDEPDVISAIGLEAREPLDLPRGSLDLDRGPLASPVARARSDSLLPQTRLCCLLASRREGPDCLRRSGLTPGIR